MDDTVCSFYISIYITLWKSFLL